MFRRLVTEHWQASLAVALFSLSALGTLLVYLRTLRMPRHEAEKRAAMALDDETPNA
jgi:hypothetical protein